MIRSDKLRDASLITHKIFKIRRIVVSSLGNLEYHGVLQVTADMVSHNCLRFNFLTACDEWVFRD